MGSKSSTLYGEPVVTNILDETGQLSNVKWLSDSKYDSTSTLIERNLLQEQMEKVRQVLFPFYAAVHRDPLGNITLDISAIGISDYLAAERIYKEIYY